MKSQRRKFRAASRLAILLLLVCFAGRTSASDSAATAPARPRIASVRIGLNNHYKLGFWTPVWVEVEGVEAADGIRVDVTAADSDGVATTASAPLQPSTTSGGRASVVIYTQVGRVDSPIRASLIGDRQTYDEVVLRPDAKANHQSAAIPLPATSELILSLGAAPFGLKEAFPDRVGDTGQTGRHVIALDNVADLPTQWFGYDAVDVLLIPAGDGKLCHDLAADKTRFAALVRWVELGGRLVVLCGGQHADELLAEGGPLAPLSPGKFAEVVRLPEAGPLEHFALSAPPISMTATTEIHVPRLTDVQGTIEVYAGRRPTELPLVVRTARGFGEIAFVGVEFSEPPLSTWPGRTAFLHALLRPYITDVTAGDATQRLVTRGYDDLSGALRQRLGRSFTSVVPIGFPLVAGLAVAYLFVLGPFDYLLIHRWLRRPWVAWVSFPLIVLAFSLVALAVGSRNKGTGAPRTNRLQLIDIDTFTGQARGTTWATVYSPEATKFDLAVDVPPMQDRSATDTETLFSWWGLPGAGIGGMQAGVADLGIIPGEYRYGPQKKSLEGVPVLASSTKSLVARWTQSAPAMLDIDLHDDEGLVAGTITNRSGVPLHNTRLFYGGWAYRLGNLEIGKPVEVGEQLSPRKVKTIVTREAFGDGGAKPAEVEGRVFAAERASAKELLTLMMFYDAAGGFGFAHLPNRYQAYIDLSRQLDLGRAILVADAPGPVTQFVDQATGEPIGDDSSDTSPVIYRFLLPVNRPDAP